MAAMALLSVLDLSPVTEGSTVSQSLANTLDLARHAEALGYKRYWLAEHHNMPGIASAATAVVIGHVAAGTSTIRVGAGGIMLPNHSPLVIAEQFGTLAALYPGRIDLGLGRAPGTDMLTARALRRNLEAGADSFPQDVVELINYFAPAEPGPARARRARRGAGGAGLDPRLRTYGAQLAAMLGLPYAFASHFAPAEMEHAHRHLPRALPAVGTARQALRHARPQRLRRRHRRRGAAAVLSLQQAFVQFAHRPAGQAAAAGRRLSRRARPDGAGHAGQALFLRHRRLAGRRCGSGLDAFVRRTGADELMVTAQIYDHAARKKSYEILAGAHAGVARAA